MVRPARSAPCGREVEDDFVALVEEAVEVVLDTVDVGGGEVRSHASVGELCEGAC